MLKLVSTDLDYMYVGCPHYTNSFDDQIIRCISPVIRNNTLEYMTNAHIAADYFISLYEDLNTKYIFT